MKNVLAKWNSINIVIRILIGMAIGIIAAIVLPDKLGFLALFGQVFVSALKAVAPILVFFIVMAAITKHKPGQETNMKHILGLYVVGTFMAGLSAVVASFIFKLNVLLPAAPQDVPTPPSDIWSVLETLVLNIVKNPVDALATGNFIGILTASILIGLVLRKAHDTTKTVISDLSDAITKIVEWVIALAPFGVMGLVFDVVATTGLKAMVQDYGKIILLLVGTMFFVALIVNPIIVFIATRQNPYPLVFKCLARSGLYAFFTRSSAANIPVNMELCEELELDKDTYSISIPLGATINMAGAAITIAILTLATVHTLGIQVDIATAVILSVLAAVSACGASGVAGGSLLLIPLACSLFGIPGDVSAQVIGVGLIIGVIQDSCETALNSSTDVLFTAAAEYGKRRKAKK
ncbi:MAG: serine/threonine transporter SstT [Eubacteriales bacterium]|nr:serine/threonine transporter SstT [Eubacteriales bacterium]MDY3332852.1 serine/threonine transporter SstT [Gallibacter sp.]